MHEFYKYINTVLSAIFIVAVVPALISCSESGDVNIEDEETGDSQQEMPIGFHLDVLSRAVDLSTIYDNFCVRSFKVDAYGTKSLVIPDYLVRNIDSRWIYYGLTNSDGTTQYLKYWDLSAHSYTFAAVTPAVSASATYTIDDDGFFTISLADLSTDVMIARTVRLGVDDPSRLVDCDGIAEEVEEIDKSAGSPSAVFPVPDSPCDPVPLNFYSILTKVVIKAYADGETEMTPLEVGLNNIGIAPATYSSGTGWTTTPLGYQQLYNQNTLISNSQNSKETALKLAELFVVPQQQTDATGSSLVQIRVKTDNNDSRVTTFNLPGVWEPNNTYTYYLKFENGETGEIILVDVNVDKFTKGDEAEKEQTNW